MTPFSPPSNTQAQAHVNQKPATAKKGSRSKYGNTAVVVDGTRFASKAEARHCMELKLREKAGEISDVQFQPRFPMYVNGELICTYVADAIYVEGDRYVVIDVKGVETDVFKLKRKLMKALHKIDVVVVK